MATQVHYIRTIHTSFTAAHPHPRITLYNAPTPPIGRKRSSSIRPPPPRVKFDPFADDNVLYNTPVSRPYTIHIPAAAPADIQRHQQHHYYHQQQQHQQHQYQQQQQPLVRVRAPRQQPTPQPQPQPHRVPTPAVVASPNTNAIATAMREREQRSKIVAGILLNRVHAVGKPMRRRASSDQPRPYVRSGLSTCIALQA